LTRLQRRRKSPSHRRPSKITTAVAGSTVVTAAVASGVVALWPSAAPGLSVASSLTAARASSALQTDGQLQPDGSGMLASQVYIAKADSAQARQLAARQAAARLAAARRRAEQRAVAAAARKAAEQAAEQAAQQAQQAAQHEAQQQSQPAPAPSASSAPPASSAPSGSPQQIAMGMLGSYGWSSSQFSCLDSLWNQESGWNVAASNSSSGAYGPDWQTNAATQIRWGLGYIQGTYGSPCSAWAHEQADGWY